NTDNEKQLKEIRHDLGASGRFDNVLKLIGSELYFEDICHQLSLDELFFSTVLRIGNVMIGQRTKHICDCMCLYAYLTDNMYQQVKIIFYVCVCVCVCCLVFLKVLQLIGETLVDPVAKIQKLLWKFQKELVVFSKDIAFDVTVEMIRQLLNKMPLKGDCSKIMELTSEFILCPALANLEDGNSLLDLLTDFPGLLQKCLVLKILDNRVLVRDVRFLVYYLEFIK
ncbi:hypothetical protein RFI_39750, partial [Reticulomyxa filosa]